MAQQATIQPWRLTQLRSHPGISTTRALLNCGVIAGSLFMVVALVQSFTRPGFDIRRLAISNLSLGELGWIQITDFIVCGALFLAMAVGVRRVLRSGPGGTWGPRLLAGWGLGLIIAGVFTTDPAFGFPPGTPDSMPATMSWHATLHSVGFFLAFGTMTAACFVLARHFGASGQRGWRAYSIATGVAAPLLVVLGMASVIATGVGFALSAVVVTWWAAAVAARLVDEASPAIEAR